MSISRDLEDDLLQTDRTTDDGLSPLGSPSSTPATNPSQLSILTQLDLEPTLPPTPAQTPARVTKRTFATAFNPSYPPPSSCKCATKCLCSAPLSPSKTPSKTTPIPASKRPFYPPAFSLLHREKAPEVSDLVSAIELQRAAEAVLAQVRWDEVSWDVASNRPGAYYRMVMERILQEKIEEVAEMRAVLEG